MREDDVKMAKAIYAILLIGILVFGLFSTSNFASALPQGTGKLVPSDKIPAAVSPPGFEKAGKTRIIAATTSEDEISNIQQKGCSVIHRLNDATSFFCPSAVVQTLDNVRVARIFQLHDLEADIQIRADRVWNELNINGGGVKVAILDTGVQASHGELSNSVLLTADFTGEGGANIGFKGHGTHVSGIVTADGIFQISGTSNLATGVAPGSNIIVGKVCKSTGCPEDAIIAGIEWAVAQNADVMNLSLGGGLSFAENCDGDPLADKVNWAVANGVVATISSGNDYSRQGVSFPACASGAIAVGAVDKFDKVARFSNSGPALDIVAPGVSILSTYSCTAVGDCNSTWYAYLSGTSMSSPHVAGVVALILQKTPTFTVDQVKQALYSTAVDVGKRDGNGRVDAWGAVNYVAAALDTMPPVISNIVTTPSSTSATITWTTNELATSRVDYGLADTYSSFVSDPTLVTSHSIHLTSLSSSTTYHFSVTSQDNSGNSASSSDDTFTTTAPPTLESIIVTPENSSIEVSSTQQFAATGSYSDGSSADITDSVAWSSSDTGVAAIDANGLATGQAAGSTTITATFGISGNTTLTVTTPPEPSNLSIDSINPTSANRGDTGKEITIYGTGFDLTAQVSFDNGNGPAPTVTNVAYVSSGELTATINVKSGGPPRSSSWDIIVTLSNGDSAVKPDALTINP